MDCDVGNSYDYHITFRRFADTVFPCSRTIVYVYPDSPVAFNAFLSE